MTAINPYLSFNGNCEEAFTYYQKVFGGKLELCRYKNAPEGSFPIAENEKEFVMHCSIQIGSTILMGADCSQTCGQKANFGDNITINICPDSAEEAKRIFAALADGGKIVMPIEKVFWSDLFGMLVDKFGIPWMINYDEPKTSNKSSCHECKS
ncbi:MAG: VOC family protein [Thermoguttaceae bacterium]